MRELVRRRATAVLGVSVLLTGVSFWLAVGGGSGALGESGKVLWAEVVVIAGIKARFILLDFMELRDAPWRLRLLLEGVVLALVTALVVVDAVT